MSDEDKVLTRVLDETISFLSGLDDRPVAARADVDRVAEALGGPLPEEGSEALEVVEALIAGAEPGVVAMPSGRFFGWVIGGVLPATLAADWLTSTWDQNAGLLVSSPAAAGAERVAVGLAARPARAAAGRRSRLRDRRHDGQLHLSGGGPARGASAGPAGTSRRRAVARAPALRVIVGAERHETVDAALRFLGLGPARSTVVRRRRARADAGGRPEGRADRRKARADDRLSAGGQRAQRGVRPDRARRSRSPIATGRGCTWTARSDCGPRPPRRCSR